MSRIKRLGVVITILLMIVTIPSSYAFESGAKWNSFTVLFRIDSLFASRLPSGSEAALRSSANQWNQVTPLNLREKTGQETTSNFVSVADFDLETWMVPCGVASTFYAMTCVSANPTTMSQVSTYLNTSSHFTWNNTGYFNAGQSPKPADVGDVVLHEFGHWVYLDDHPTPRLDGAVMDFQEIAKPLLYEDDMQGITQRYGPYTGFDYDSVTLAARARGLEYDFNNTNGNFTTFETYKGNVESWHYFPTGYPYPEMGVRGPEAVNGIMMNPKYNDKQLMIGGYATTATNSWVYFKLFSWLADSRSDIVNQPGNANDVIPNYMIIPSGAVLNWCQHNYQQQTMSIDAYFTDGTAMRDAAYDIKDQYGTRIHPLYRPTQSSTTWYCYSANLNNVVGKQVANWYISYDNQNTTRSGTLVHCGGNNTMVCRQALNLFCGRKLYGYLRQAVLGNFRAYFDGIRLTCPTCPKP